MSAASLALLESLTQADAVPGHEAEVRAILRSRLATVGAIEHDRLGSVFCTKRGTAESPRILLDSHLDEVGFIVHSVTPAGMVKFLPLGNWWAHALLAQRVRITTARGKILGVIGSRPPHLLKPAERERVLDLSDLFIDIGVDTHEQAVALGVTPGCAIAPYSPFLRLEHGQRFLAKAFDNRVGVALVIETLERLGDHPNTVIGSGSAQEEVGFRGARAVTELVQPDLAIVLEGPYADDAPPGAWGTQCRIGGGVHVRLFDTTMITNPRLAEMVIETACAAEIPHQLAVWAAGGTDAAAIHQSGRGVPTIVLGVPVRYIHSHASVVDLADYRAALDLLLALIPRLNGATVERISTPR